MGVLAGLLILLAAGWLALGGSKDVSTRSKIGKPGSHFDWKSEMVRKGRQELRRNEGERGLRFKFMQARADAMPEQMRRAIAVSVGGVSALGLRFDHAHFLPTATGGGVWVTEGDGVTCMSSAASGATSCDTSLHAWRKGLPLEVCRPTASPRDLPTDCLALGIVPNGARAVRVRIGHATRVRVVQALEGTYALRAPVPIDVVGMVR